MITLSLKRHYFGETYTIGRLYVNGVYFCDTLEDRYRDLSREEKVYGKTAIPEGEYPVRVTYSRKFRKMMPEVLNVPYFTGIRIHGGRNEDDTSGCVLVGFNRRKGRLECGMNVSKSLTNRLLQYQNRGESITIRIFS